jgi:hypothetical protein
VTDVLFGTRDFVGTLPYTWPRDARSCRSTSTPCRRLDAPTRPD